MNKIIALWAHPRSRSTVLERVFIERKDFQVFHEPFAHMAFGPESTIPSDEWDEQLPRTYQDIKDTLLDARQRGHVFHKDMCYHCEDELKNDAQFLLQHTNIFLIREPIDSILSHHSIFPDMPLEAIGHKAMYEVFCAVTKLTGAVPYVINADDLANNPEHVIRKLCDYLNIEFFQNPCRGSPSAPNNGRRGETGMSRQNKARTSLSLLKKKRTWRISIRFQNCELFTTFIAPTTNA